MTNSKKCQVGVKGIIKSFSIDQCDNMLVHLSHASAGAQFYTSKSSDTHIRISKENDDGDYTELVVPEQFVFTVNKDRKLEAKVSELYDY